MILSDVTIREAIENDFLSIEPFDTDDIEPASVDLRLGDEVLQVHRRYMKEPVDTRDENDDGLMFGVPDAGENFVTIYPGQFYLATTKEYVSLPDKIAATVLGRSSLGRLGVSVHQTAGFIDPGFEGEVTLELSNHGPAPVKLYHGDRICQMVFYMLTTEAERPYGHERSQYQGQTGATPSRMQFD